MKTGDRFPPSPESRTVRVDDSSWTLSLAGFCEVLDGRAREALYFSPRITVEIRIAPGSPLTNTCIEGSPILNEDPAAWGLEKARVLKWVRKTMEERLAPDPQEALFELGSLLDSVRLASIKAMVAAQAEYLVSLLPAEEARSVWNAAEVRRVFET